MLDAALQDALTRAAASPRLLVTSDFDGTLSPIVDNPGDARPLPAAAAALEALAALPDTTAALISGRALAVLRELSGASAAVQAIGSHGAEFDTGFAHEIDTTLLAEIVTTLHSIAAGRPGVAVETKPASVALHVRNASVADGEAALTLAREAARSWDVHLTAGKAVLEFAVIVTDKGEAVDVLRDRSAATAVVFLGDDVTDEKAFRRMRDGDIGVKVGPGDSLAAFRVDSPEDVASVLAYLVDERRRKLA
ncbi:trehalose-phosphatase [Mycolicibacterium bacteremicum]|uniref:Trehalose 6-phosphate phosphatase n=1 Tax=Mycolicibacterium bacteremicum TaxID=564198 RepID=A0A1W9YXC3_MYCBA|nr:trehalose-phosphatase [Mycolicibacterium bacteremicum]MCV7435429.1 trehalose-phosphatase [Mycolicibacterium bacteremicum]ORA04629.1 trehalose-phosphatase [Mycolicibacterium bacteremicum]